MKREQYPIDFVLFWVDPLNKQWQQEKAEYQAKASGEQEQEGNLAVRYRDWDNLQYWFRGVDKYAPWVRKVYLVTWGAVPEWLDTANPKLEIVYDHDILPEGCAPVFSSNPKDVNIHRIPGLSEHFVYFNDDMFLTKETQPTDFFVNGLPREMAVSYQLANDADNDSFQHILFTMSGVINGLFSKKEVQRKHWHQWYTLKYGKQVINTLRTRPFRFFSGIMIPHLPSPLRRSTCEEVWQEIPDHLMLFHSPVLPASGCYKYGKEYFFHDGLTEKLCSDITTQRYKMICINDSREVRDFESCKAQIREAFDRILPDKSSFEKDNHER